MLRVNAELNACASMEDIRNLLVAEFKQRNPCIVARHKWLKIRQTKDESFTDFLSRKKANWRSADVDEINTEKLVAHVILAGC